MSDINQNEIDALLNYNEQTVEDETGKPCSVDDIVSQALAEEGVSAGKESPSASVAAPSLAAEAAPAVVTPVVAVEVDTASLAVDDPFEQIRAAQKILFEVFSSIPDKKERSRLINWANDAFIRSKYF